jgi:hypothetical protein
MVSVVVIVLIPLGVLAENSGESGAELVHQFVVAHGLGVRMRGFTFLAAT